MLIFPISSLENKFDPQNTACMPAVKLIFRLELEKIIYSVTACRPFFVGAIPLWLPLLGQARWPGPTAATVRTNPGNHF